jgi:NAD(P)-dependent dehydrogenase (short-subunit alcohol dehydrogenase family)
VNISSIGGRVAQPFVGPYVASKHAIEGLNDVLRLELMGWDIKVIAIEPGTFATPIWDKGSAQVEEALEKMPPEQHDLYRERLGQMPKIIARQNKRGVPPSKVAEAIEQALTAKRPKTRYLVGDARLLLTLKTVLRAPLFDRLLYRMTS